MRNPSIPILVDPKLIDLALTEIQEGLIAKLTWLNYAFGKSVSRKHIKGKMMFVRPEVYVGDIEYLGMFPDSHLGNYSFFSVKDGENIDSSGNFSYKFSTEVGLIFWFDYRKIYPVDWKQRTIDNVKFDIITAMKSFRLRNSEITFIKTWEKADNIYREYSDKEIDLQFLMRPYGGIRIDFDLNFNEIANC